jgi:hypothetical protein
VQAFEGGKDLQTAVTGSQKKSNNVWVLTEEAIQHGVKSTTRYRKPTSNKKTSRTDPPAPQRQRSGAKGGRAAKKWAKNRRLAHDVSSSNGVPAGSLASYSCSEPLIPNYTTTTTDYVQPLSITTPRRKPELDGYDFSQIVECTTYPAGSPIFYHDDRTGLETFDAQFPFSTNQGFGPDFSQIY